MAAYQLRPCEPWSWRPKSTTRLCVLLMRRRTHLHYGLIDFKLWKWILKHAQVISICPTDCFWNIDKIRIGYVLKSADVRTLVSSRYSENSSNTYPHTPVHTCTLPRTPTPHIPAHALNLINHMKLHVNKVNRKMAEKRKKEKRKGGRNKSPLIG